MSTNTDDKTTRYLDPVTGKEIGDDDPRMQHIQTYINAQAHDREFKKKVKQ